ncbi:hypothetical protein DL768_010719 [Monosporascus sp. mg162]|nr:hypothetical protein DL768_010719 [Monosporascus sp. mg162]
MVSLKTDMSWSSLAIYVGILGYHLILLPIYNVFFHPLRKYPGPKLWATSALPWGFAFMSGNYHHKILELHSKYGHIVRVGPNQLSYDVPEAWEDIYGRSKQRKENPKPTWYLSPKRNEIVGAEEKDHVRMRGLLAKGFTGSAMLEQEPLIKKNVDLLFQRFREKAGDGKAELDIFEWFSYCTFDIIGDLTFGETFGCLRQSMMHPWLATVFANVKLAHTLVLCNRIPFFFFYLPFTETWRLWRSSKDFDKTIHEVIDKYSGRGAERQDFLRIMQTKKRFMYMTKEEVYSNSAFVTLAGSETTSTVMAVVVYMICTNPPVKAKLLQELHATFASEDEINMRSATKLRYLMAVIEESMRCHPPGPNALWRVTPPGGNRILGDWIPEKASTVLDVPHRTMYRSEHNFKRADEFIPERWIECSDEKSEFANDRRDSFHPFSYGPRTCLAVNLAYAEIRFILARLMWNFEIDITEECQKWKEGMRSWLIWEKRPLNVYLKPREGVTD